MNELTWEQQQDINDYLAWKIDNDWHTKGHTVMPQTIVRETTVYTLAELEALGWSVHEKAIQNVIEWNWEGWEPSWYSDDIAMLVEEEYKPFAMERTSLEWSTNPNWIRAKGSIDVAQYMKDQKLCNKFRSLWYAMRVHSLNADVPVNFGFGYCEQVDLGDLYDEVSYFVAYDSARYWKIEGEIDRLRADMHAYMDAIEDRLLSNLSAEIYWICSEKKAKEDIEANELVFTEDGAIFHG